MMNLSLEQQKKAIFIEIEKEVAWNQEHFQFESHSEQVLQIK
jgi:hypothetical protein